MLSKINSVKIKAEIFWYADKNNNLVDINNPPKDPLPTVLKEIIDNSDWNKFSINVGVPANFDYGRIVLSVEQYDKGGTGTAYFDKFTLGERYYCVPDIAGLEDDTIWENNLDASNKKSCENAGDKEFGKGFTWTGDHCCGDKANEFYTDDGYSKEAGCWNSTKVTNGSLVQDDNRVLNFNGKFYSCNVDAGDRLFTDVKNTDYITPTPLIEATDADENVKLCTTFNSRNNIGIAQGYYCSPNGANGKSIWKNDAVKDTKVLGAERVAYKRTKLSSTAQSMFALVKNECCPQNTCWNGTECMHDQTGMPWERPSYNYRCVENETGSVDWRVPVKKISWDGMQEGYCPTESYCLVPNANINSIKCIKSQEYIGNHYCDDGQWSTRTRLVAEALLNYTLDNSPDDFTLYCDEYKNALPDIKSNPEYVGDQQATAEVFLTKAGATHVCVLETGDGKKLVGTAADVPIDAELNFGSAAQSSQSSAAKKFQFISLFSPNPDACKNIILNSNEFTKCTGDTSSGAINRNIWVNNKTKLVIFSNKDITLNPKPTALSILEFLVNPLQATISFIRNILRPKIIVANINLDIIKKPKDFTRFYFAKYKKDGKDLMIRSVIETQRDKDSLLAEYEGYSTDICQRAIEAYDDKRVNKDINDPLAITDDIQCYPAINTSDSANSKIIYKVVMQKDSREGIPTKFWQDLTGKIRPKQYAASDASQSNLPVPNAEILLPLALYRVSELMQQGLRLTSGKNTDAVSYYWNLDTHEDYAGIFGSAGELQYNKTFMLSDLYANPKRVSGNYNISLIVIGRDGKFSFTSKQVNFESVLGTGIQQGCKKKLGDANNDNKVDLTDYPLLRAIAKSCIETYNKPLTQGAVVSGEGYDLMNETCVCADMDQKEGLQYGSPTTAYDVDPQTDPTKQDENEFVEVCGNQICDADDDGFIDQPNIDNCVDVSNHDQRDTDHARDYELKNADQIDLGAGIPKLLKIERSIGDACDNCTDTDHDGFGNPGFKISGCELNQTEYDNCQDNKFNPLQEDMDNDDIGDACDDDIDGDGKNNQEDGAIIYRDCSLENSKKCSVFQEFKSESGCCEKRNMFLQADAELKNSCMQNEVAVLCLSGELNAHGATVLPATAAPNTCPAGYKPICYPKTPVTGLTSNTCNTQNSTVALNLSDAPNNMNAHAASKLLQSLDARRNISTSISGKSVDLGSRKKIVKVKANVCGKKIWSGSVNTPWTDSVKWKIQLFNPSNIAAADGYKELSLTHTSGSCQDITFDFGAGVDAEKIGISYDYTPAETCWDRIQNNQETFIDCGGPNCNACVCDWYFCRPWFYTGREPEAGWANFGCEGKGCKGRGPGLTCIADMDIPRDHTLSPTSPISVAWYADYNFRFGTFANPIPEKQYNTAYTKYEYCGKAPGVNVILESEPYLSLTSYEEEVGSILTGQSIGYNTPVCVQSELGNMTCTYAERCMANEFCLVTLSPGTNNLHLAECDSSEDSKAYSQKVCCTLGNEMRKTCLTRANQETPCTRKCGNGIRESPENDEGVNEDCDGKDLGGKTQCNQLDPEYVAGDLKCTSGCTYDTAGCFDQEQYDKAQALPTSPKCGNGVVDTQFGEECDGRDLQSKIFCTDLNKGGRKIYETGKLSCIRPGESNACKYNTINCRGSCGNNKIDANEKCDPTVNPVLDYTCYNYSTITPLIRTFGMITRCSALCEYDTSHCNPVIPDQDTDRKCVPDGKLQWWNGEQCDPLLTPIDTTCEEQGYGAGTLGCNSDCGYEFASCGANLGNTCGNGNVETHEDCDKGADLTAGTEDDVFRTDKLIPIKERRQVHAINPDGTLKTDPYGSPIWTDEWVVTGTQRVPETCVDHDYGTGELGCNNDCTINIEGCDDSSLLCGNRIIDSAEDCDPSAVPEFTTDKDSCSEIGLGFTGGELRCTNRCEYDPTKCT
ncbi:TPA: hypothetical protein HA246_01265 [Candidatus Woesearchaeota archaeon]|nr:hypothetical protein [Candidatus Woesearchaeota archaeon]